MSTPVASTQTPNRPWLALLGVGAALGSVLLALTFISEPPRTIEPRPQPTTPTASRAAIAVRDFADPYQQWGAMMFALPVLRRGYRKLTYINQRSEHDQEARLLTTLTQSLRNNTHTDLFLLSHGSRRYLDIIKSRIPRHLRHKLRLVYHSGCGNARQGPTWRRIGVEAYVGHGGGISVSPVFFFFFLRRWIEGYSLKRAIHEANWYTRHHLLLVGRASFGWLNGPTLWGHTKAQLYGNADLRIQAPATPPMISHATPPHNDTSSLYTTPPLGP